MRSRMRESASTDLREPQGSNPLGPPGPELRAARKAHRGGGRPGCNNPIPSVGISSRNVRSARNSPQLVERVLADVWTITLDQLGEITAVGEGDPIIDRPQEAPSFGGETATILVNEGETQHFLIEIATLRIVDDDVSLTHVRHATPIPRILAESLPHDCNLLVCDESGQLLPQKHLGIGILVNLETLGDRFDESTIALHREEAPGLPRLGLGLVEVKGLALSVHMLHSHRPTLMKGIPPRQVEQTLLGEVFQRSSHYRSLTIIAHHLGHSQGTSRASRGREKGTSLGREKGTSLTSTVREGKEPQGHARKRLMQAA